MAAVDVLSISDGKGDGAKRWIAGGVFALALHVGALLILREAPEHVGAGEQPAIELDMTPPAPAQAPSVETPEVQQTPPDQAQETPPEELPEVQTDNTPPPPDTDVVAAETPPEEEVETLPEQETVQEAPPDLAEAPPDVKPVVTLPPPDTVVAQEETPEPVKREKPVEKRQVAKKEPKKEPKKDVEPKPDAKPARAPAPAKAPPPSAGANAAAASAASSQYGAIISRLLAAQKRYPAAAQAERLAGRGGITFTVNRSGRVVSQSFRSTGSAVLDQALREMLQRASGSFPPMPADMPGSSKTFSVPVSFSFRG